MYKDADYCSLAYVYGRHIPLLGEERFLFVQGRVVVYLFQDGLVFDIVRLSVIVGLLEGEGCVFIYHVVQIDGGVYAVYEDGVR